jgi:saccharopine dehydrogenase-like NADP-dependent oxidoreductase
MLNIFEGTKDGKRQRMTSTVTIERDLDTGLMGMSMGVGYPVAIAARMVLRGEIPGKGVLSPTEDIPVARFKEELKERGIVISETLVSID